ncbi:MAG: amino acid permease [bacterium]|nr:amino acid permease [bacterium]
MRGRGGLKQVLGAADAGWLVAGCMIGAGMFYTPGLVVGSLPSAGWVLAAWIVGGMLAVCGAAVYAELGARLPRAGGDYQFLKHSFGPAWGFLTGWASFTVTFSAAVAAMVIVGVRYLDSALGNAAPPWLTWVAPPLIVLALTAANTAGARVAGRTTLWLTILPVLSLMLLFGVGILLGDASMQWPGQRASGAPTSRILGFGAALIPVYFTYTGWNSAAYVAGEIRDPGRNLSRALLGGTLFVTLLYVAWNLMLLLVVPYDELAGSTTAGAQAARVLLGDRGERVLSAAVAVAVFGTANVTLMSGSRIYYAMALDHEALRPLARVGSRGVPTTALWVGGVWTALLAAIGRVDALVNWTTLAILILSSLTVVGLFVLRRRAPDATTFRCPGYPLTPAIYLVASCGVAFASARYAPWQALAGATLVLAGLPVYFVVRRLSAAERPTQ